MEDGWLDKLKHWVCKNPLVVFQFDGDEWSGLSPSERGENRFTVARPHALLEKIRKPTACLVLGTVGGKDEAYFGTVSRFQAMTTLVSRIKVSRAQCVQPTSKRGLLNLVTEKPHARTLRSRLPSKASVAVLSPNLSVHLVERLVETGSNRGAMHAAIAPLLAPKHFDGMEALQQDAFVMALRAFGLSPDHRATSLYLAEGRSTALAGANIMEDAVVEHDARSIPGYTLIDSDITGRAVFERGHEQLEVYTANRRHLEEVFGVDLIYLNKTRHNIVMVQYKMLERHERKGRDLDWIYRPNAKLDSQIKSMRRFSKQHQVGAHEYRLNQETFYLKFVKRQGALDGAGIVIPVEHFERLRTDPSCKGPRGAVRVSYNSLGGRYLRQGSFLGLIGAGYIGATVETTTHFKTLVEEVVREGRAAVGAIQSSREDEGIC